MAIMRNTGAVPVVAALGANFLITLIKAGAASVSGSSVMFSEAIHSLADTLNQLLLLIGVGRSTKKANEDFDYGYGQERFFWALISACGIFFIGAGVTLYRGITSLLHPQPLEIHALVFVVLAASFIFESCTFWIATRELKHSHPNASWGEYLAESDPATLAVFFEDGVALVGVVVAALAIGISWYTSSVVWDAYGSIIIGVLLGMTAIVLIIKNRSYLLGKAIPRDERDEIIAALVADPAIERVIDFKSSVLGIGVYRIKCEVEFNGSALFEEAFQRSNLRRQYDDIKDDYEEFKRFCVDYADRIPRLMGKKIDRVEKMLRQRFPAVHHIDIEIN